MAEEQTPVRRTELRLVLPGILLAMLLSQLDSGILSTALPTVVSDLGGISHLSWAVTAYLLTLTASTPLYGKLGDIYGRKRVFIGAILIFLVGSMLSGLSQTMNELVAFRALQGLGAGGLVVNVIAIIGELAPPRERGKYQSYVAVLGTVAAIAGPLIGGFFTDHLSWRWVFYVNVPIGIVSLAIVAAKLHLERTRVRHRVDYLGALSLIVVSVLIVLVTSWGGTQYGWGSPLIIALVVAGLLIAVGVVLVERRAAEPVLPMRLFTGRNFAISQVLSFMVGFGMYGAISFLPLYEQAVQHSSATNSGLMLLPFLLGSTVTTLGSGVVLSHTDDHRPLLFIGAVGVAAGFFLLSLLGTHTGRPLAFVYMLVFGLGIGFLYQVTTVTAQNSVAKPDLGVTSSSTMFFRMSGGSFGVALFGAILTSRLTASLSGRLSVAETSRLVKSGGQIDPTKLGGAGSAVRVAYTQGVANGTHSMFLWSVPAGLVAIALASAVRRIRPAEVPEQQPGQQSKAVASGG